jgi:hypothetical protein
VIGPSADLLKQDDKTGLGLLYATTLWQMKVVAAAVDKRAQYRDKNAVAISLGNRRNA